MLITRENTIRFKNSYFTLLILVFSAYSAHASLDSLNQIWNNESKPDAERFQAINELCNSAANAEPAKVLKLAESHLELAKLKNAQTEIGNAMFHKVLALRGLGHYDDALKELDKLIEIRQAAKDPIGLAKSYRLKGVMFHYKSKYFEAVNAYLKSLAINKEMGLLSAEARVLSNLAMVYSEINNYDLAMDYYDKSIQLYERLGMEDKLNLLTLNIGFTHYEQLNYNQAISNGRKVKEYLKTTNHKVGLADCYYLLGQSYKAINEINSALYYVEESLKINLSIGNPGQIIPTKLLYADILLDIDVDKAKGMVEELTPIVDTSFGYAYLTQMHHLLYRCHKAKGDLTSALGMHEKFSLYKDSLIVEEDNIEITRQTLENQYEIELLNTQLENEQKQSALQFSQLKRTFAIILASSLIICVIGFYARLNFLNQKREKENLLKEIKELKSKGNATPLSFSPKFQLERRLIEESIKRKINETDWKVLNILFEDPVITNKEIAKKAFLTVDGIGSCLRRMYQAFDIKESKYKKISLIMKAIKISNAVTNISQE